MVRSFETYSGSYQQAGSAASTLVATEFQSITGGQITSLWWRRADTTPSHKPTHLGVFDVATGVLLVDLVTFTDDGAVGWQETDLANPIVLAAGRSYAVGALWAAGFYVYNPAVYDEPVPPYPLTWGSSKRAFKSSSSFTFSGVTQDSNGWYALDASVTPGNLTPGDPGALPSDVENSLASWLRDDVENSHKDTSSIPGLPWTIKSTLTTFRTAFDTVVGSVTETASATGTVFQRVNQLLADTAALLGRIPTTITTGFDQLFSWYGAAGRPVGADTVPTALTAIRDALDADVGVELLRERLTLSPDLSDLTRWSVVGTVEGTGSDEVVLQADLYVLAITSAGAERSALTIGSYTWRRYLGWVAPTVHGAVLPRRQLEWDFNAVCHPPLLMDGLLIHTGPDVEWLLTAYVLDRS